MPYIRGGSVPLLWQVSEHCSNPLALLDCTFLVCLLDLCSIYFFITPCAHISAALIPQNRSQKLKARKKDKGATGVFYLESCMLPLEDSIVLAHQRRNPICLCKFRVMLQRTSFSHSRWEWEKTLC